MRTVRESKVALRSGGTATSTAPIFGHAVFGLVPLRLFHSLGQPGRACTRGQRPVAMKWSGLA